VSQRWSIEDYERYTGQKLTPLRTQIPTGVKVTKYRNRRVFQDGRWFDSQREADRARELQLMEKAGLITDLVLDKRQLRYPLLVNGKKIGTYTADSRYYENGILVVEDVKSKPTKTREYRRTRKHMRALYGIEIREIINGR
jgi:hypothetical protein